MTSPPSSWKIRSARLLAILCGPLVLASCYYTPDVVRAFDGDYSEEENQKVITEYCQSCHNHRNFEPESHMDEMRALYKKRLYQAARSCRLCHYVEDNFVGDEITRGTRRPGEVKRGKHRAYEKEFIHDLTKERSRKKKKEKKTEKKKSFWNIF